MESSGKQNNSHEETRRNMMAGLGIGAALGVIFWSALDGLLPTPFDLIVGMATGLITGYSIGKRSVMLMRYPSFVIRRMLLAGAAFLLGMFAYYFVLDLNLDGGVQMLLSLLAIVPAIVFILAIGSAIGHLDEMQRRIQTEAIAIAFAGTAIVVVVLFFLGLSGVPNPNWGWLLVVMAITLVLGKLWTVWRYR